MAYRTAILATVLCGVSLVCGCGLAQTPSEKFQAEDPKVRIDAAIDAARKKDSTAVSYLVDRLEDPESDVRFFSFLALKEITGRTMGWRHYYGRARRAEAVKKWRDWLRQGRPKVNDDGDEGSDL